MQGRGPLQGPRPHLRCHELGLQPGSFPVPDRTRSNHRESLVRSGACARHDFALPVIQDRRSVPGGCPSPWLFRYCRSACAEAPGPRGPGTIRTCTMILPRDRARKPVPRRPRDCQPRRRMLRWRSLCRPFHRDPRNPTRDVPTNHRRVSDSRLRAACRGHRRLGRHAGARDRGDPRRRRSAPAGRRLGRADGRSGRRSGRHAERRGRRPGFSSFTRAAGGASA